MHGVDGWIFVGDEGDGARDPWVYADRQCHFFHSLTIILLIYRPIPVFNFRIPIFRPLALSIPTTCPWVSIDVHFFALFEPLIDELATSQDALWGVVTETHQRRAPTLIEHLYGTGRRSGFIAKTIHLAIDRALADVGSPDAKRDNGPPGPTKAMT